MPTKMVEVDEATALGVIKRLGLQTEHWSASDQWLYRRVRFEGPVIVHCADTFEPRWRVDPDHLND